MSKPVHGNVVSIYLEPNKPLRAAVAVMDTVIIDTQILDLEGDPVNLTECTVIVTATDRNGTILYTVSVTNAEQGRFRVIVQPRVHGQLKLTAKVSIDGAADQYTWFIGSLSVAVDEDGDPAEAIRSLTDDILDAYQRAKEVADDTKGYSADAKRYSDLALSYSINSQSTANESALQAQIAKENAEASHTSELNAGQSAKEALASATNASDSANAAETSAATATQKAQEASASAESASASATSASASASQAADSASSASTSASQAKTSETNAETSEANSSAYASSALSSANTAKAMATDAQTFAGQASDSADSASASATSASSSADTATVGASTATAQAAIATDKATASANSASQASASATAAKASETNASAILNDVLVSQETVNGYLSDALKAVTDSASNAESAATSATNASNSATEASNSAQSALASKNSASSSAESAQESANRAQELADSLIIENLDQRYLAIAGNASSATKLSTARKINGVAFDGTQDITVKDDTKLPLSGGTMTGNIRTNRNELAIMQNTNVSISDTSRTSAYYELPFSVQDKDGKRGAAFVVAWVGDGSRWCYVDMRDRTDSKYISAGFREDADGRASFFCDGSEALLPVGAVFPFAGNYAPAGCLLCNGAAVSRTTYKHLFNAIGTTYGAGDGSTTFNLPNLTDRFIQGSGTAGTVKNAGLPNINGHAEDLRSGGRSAGQNYTSGCVTQTFTSTSYAVAFSNYLGCFYGFNIDASKSNSIYGASATVQLPALTMRYYIKY